uniref:NB-ARC domain-containing protein n=1 Tax=Aegilops tauschii subsp. strangulata TaxID=200361 RepID=A0A452ZN12_AEGTS|nr:disease resistance protein RGA2 [Aegilops tauschii subsp. strangulata]
MEALISAVLGDIVSRAISVVVDKCREQTTTEEDLERLRQLLLRISIVVEEAEGRLVTNRGMIRQVCMMREQMFRGYYLLDAFRCREKNTEEDEVSHCSFARSAFSPAKRFRRLSSSTQTESMIIACRERSSKELKQVVLGLETMVADMKEFAVFLMSYPRMHRQPRSTYLFMDRCMFGRQMEMEHAINFLLQADQQILGNGDPGVLPIVGSALIGKSTLVEHVCDDERVRNHFSSILFYTGDSLTTDETATTFRDNCTIKHQNINIASVEERSLLVVELCEDFDEDAWRGLLRSSTRSLKHVSKIIITSRSEKVASLGTTEAVRLERLPEEAYWYFFRTLAFGSTDPEDHPELTSIGMELAVEMRGSFMNAFISAGLLLGLGADRLRARTWRRVLAHFRDYRQKNTLLLGGEYPLDLQSRYVWSMAQAPHLGRLKLFLLRDSYQRGPDDRTEVPRVTAVDLLSGSAAVPLGRSEVLFWRSLVPPYYRYMYVCECEFVRHKNKNTTIEMEP